MKHFTISASHSPIHTHSVRIRCLAQWDDSSLRYRKSRGSNQQPSVGCLHKKKASQINLTSQNTRNIPAPVQRFYSVAETMLFSVKIAISRKRTVHVRPPSLCELEISLQGVKLIMSLEDEYDTLDEVREMKPYCCHTMIYLERKVSASH